MGIEAGRFKDGKYRLTNQWLEFKPDLENLLVEFDADDADPSKKYFEQVNLAVVQGATEGSFQQYDVQAYDDSNWFQRTFYGATHQVTSGGSAHRLDVIEITYFDPPTARRYRGRFRLTHSGLGSSPCSCYEAA